MVIEDPVGLNMTQSMAHANGGESVIYIHQYFIKRYENPVSH